MKTKYHIITALILIAAAAPALGQTFQRESPSASDIAEVLGISFVKLNFSFEKPTYMKVVSISGSYTSEYPLKKPFSNISLKITAKPDPLEIVGKKPESLIVNAALNAQEGGHFLSAFINPTLNIPDKVQTTLEQTGPTLNPSNPSSTSIPMNENFLVYEYSVFYKSQDGEEKNEKLSVYVFASEEPLHEK